MTGREKGSTSVRLLGIDAPELAGHCRKGRNCTPGDGARARQILAAMVKRGAVACNPQGFDSYGRTLARCKIGTIDLSCELVRRDAAVFRYREIDC